MCLFLTWSFRRKSNQNPAEFSILQKKYNKHLGYGVKIWKYLRKGKNSRRSVDSANCFRLFSEIQDFSSELTKPVCLSPLVNITICGNLGFLTYLIIACTFDCSKILTNSLKKSFLSSNICKTAIYFFFYIYSLVCFWRVHQGFRHILW